MSPSAANSETLDNRGNEIEPANPGTSPCPALVFHLQ